MPGNLPFPETAELMSVMSNGEWNSVPWIESQLEQRGFEDINVRVETAKIAIQSSVFVEMTMLVLPIMVKSFWNEDQRENFEDKVRAALEKYVVDTYGSDGNIETNWVAILSTAHKAS
jgi:hypothetical protein